MESGYEPEQMSNATCMRLSHLQVGAVMQTGLQKEASCTNPVHNSIKLLHIPLQCTSQYPPAHSSSHSFHGNLGSGKCFRLVDRSDKSWRGIQLLTERGTSWDPSSAVSMGLLYSFSRETMVHLETHHLLCLWDCFTVSAGRQWYILRPITRCVHGIAF
jgi:hypothetical protein